MPDGHTTKAGTPTMGGVAIVVAAVVGYAVAHLHGGAGLHPLGVLVMLAITGAGVVGAFDDWIKVSHERNLGLSKRAKMGGLLVVAVGFAVACAAWTDAETTVSFTRWDEPGWQLTDVGLGRVRRAAHRGDHQRRQPHRRPRRPRRRVGDLRLHHLT